MFSEITFNTPILKDVEYTFTISPNLNWQKGQKTFIHYSDSVWWTGVFTEYNINDGMCKIKCLESSNCRIGKYTGTLDIYTLRGPPGTRGPGTIYYSDIIGQLKVPNIGDEICLRPRKRQLSWQKGQRIFIYTDEMDWLYGNILSYENDQINVIIIDKGCNNNCNILEKIYVDIAGVRGVEGPPGPPCKWSLYGMATHVQNQTIKRNIKSSLKFDTVIQDDGKLFKDDTLILDNNIHSIGIKFLTTGFTDGVLFLSLELVSRYNNEIIPDIRYTFVKTILPQQPAVCELFPPLKTFESGDMYKIFAWFSGTEVDVDIKMLYVYYST